MNTFEKHFQRFPSFVKRILGWQPDFIVPVAKKGCKLLKSYEGAPPITTDLIRYKSFFESTNQSVTGKKIAVIDDATQYTSTLQEYRRFFENLGAAVRTFSFVGHERLFEGRRWQYDEQAEIEIFLPDPVYQEYILQQSYYLLNSGAQFDLDHLIFEVALEPARLQDLCSYLSERGELLTIESYFLTRPIERFSLNNVCFFNSIPFLSETGIRMGPLRKLKFNYDKDAQRLLFSPLVFPTWDVFATEIGNRMFRAVPFSLPFSIPRLVDPKNKGALLRVYNNIYFTYVVSLAKAFARDAKAHFDFCKDLKIRRNDLDAVLGPGAAQAFMTEVTHYVCKSDPEDFSKRDVYPPMRKARIRYNSFGEVIDDLKNGYLRKVKKKKTRVAVHHFISYDYLFKKCKDPISLSENIDYYCDFGVIVPETIFQNGRMERVVRTGEPVSDYNWRRTQVLIPLAIEQNRLVSQSNNYSIDPMSLNKLLSNFIFDYPSEQYHELHCLIGKPYTFGTLVRVYHHHRAPNSPSLYESERISPFYRWNAKQRKFSIFRRTEMVEIIKGVFDERQEVPYSEIVSYFKFFSTVLKFFKTVDVLTTLSICREENYFYSHILYNVRSWSESYSLFLDEPNQRRKLKILHEAGTHANSSSDKLKLAQNTESIMKTVNGRFGRDVEFIKIVERINRNYYPFTRQFEGTLENLNHIIKLQLVISNLSLLVETRGQTYARRLEKLNYRHVLKSAELTAPTDPLTLKKEQSDYVGLITAGYAKIRLRIESLSLEEGLLSTRLQNESRTRARNIATSYVYREALSQAAFLFMDFTGLRMIPEPKEEVIGRYYSLVESTTRRRGAVKLYGGQGGDDAFTILFPDLEPALQCAKDIKRAFSEDLFLRASNGDIKFGLSFVNFPEDKKEQEVLEGWGNAKDCCEYKGTGFRNRGDLLVSEITLAHAAQKNQGISERFERVEGEFLKVGASLWRFKEIQPF